MTKTYSLANPTAICAKILAAGGPAIDPSQPTGSVVTHGCKLVWTMMPGSIAITLVSHPWVMPESVVLGQLDKLFGGAQ